MSQKSSVPQAAKSVSQALISDSCHHDAVLDIEHISDDVELLTAFPDERMVCTKCGMIGTADVRPN